MNRKFDDMGPSAERIDAMIDSFNAEEASDPDIDPDLREVAATVRGLRRHREVMWPERISAVPRLMARRLAGLVQFEASASTSDNGAYFTSNSGKTSNPAIDWDHTDEPNTRSHESGADVLDDQIAARRSRTREALRIAAAVVGFGVVAAALIAIFQPGNDDQGLGAGPGASTVGEIVYVSITGENDSDIMLINDDGSNARNLTKSPGTIVQPRWSPDGQRITFVSNEDGSNRIYVMGSDGSGRQPVSASLPGDQFHPAWSSPDGNQIAFIHYNAPDEDGQRRVDLVVVDLATGSRRTITTVAVFDQNRGVPVFSGPAWSPDGKWLAFARGSGAGTGQELVVIRPSGDQTVTYQTGGGFMVPPAWSPDGRYLAYGTIGTNSHLIVRDFLTDTVIQKTAVAAIQIIDLTWTADGSEIFFSTAHTSTGDIFKMSVASGEISQITNWIGREYMMDLSPDGSQIAVVFVPPVDTRPDDGEEVMSQLIVMNVDGTERRVLASDVGVGASWRPAR